MYKHIGGADEEHTPNKKYINKIKIIESSESAAPAITKIFMKKERLRPKLERTYPKSKLGLKPTTVFYLPNSRGLLQFNLPQRVTFHAITLPTILL